MDVVSKFVEHPEQNEKLVDQMSKVKFKIMSLKVKGPMDYIPDLVCGTASVICFNCVFFFAYLIVLYNPLHTCFIFNLQQKQIYIYMFVFLKKLNKYMFLTV